MFNNIGEKIKSLAIFSTIIGIVLSALLGIRAIFTHSFIEGLLIVAIGSFMAWIASFLLYGYGELIENTQIIASNMPKKNTPLPKSVATPKKDYLAKYRTTPATAGQKTSCPYCLETINETDTECKSCGSKLK